MSVIASTVTIVGRDNEAKLKAGLHDNARMYYFRIGEGGWVDAGGGVIEPKVPDENKTRLESDGTLLTGKIRVDPAGVNPKLVEGNGTLFLTEVAPLLAPGGSGAYIQLDTDGVMVEVASVTDDENLELVADYPAAWPGSPVIYRYGGVLSAAYSPWYTFSKVLELADLTFLGAGTGQMEALCKALVGEANDNGYGASPEFWEAGVYLQVLGEPDVLMVYATFPGVTKVVGRQISFTVRGSW